MKPNTKRMIWIPLVIGVITGLLVITADTVGFRIPSGYHNDVADSREIFYSLCAALAGPLGVLASQTMGWFLNPTIRGFVAQSNLISSFVLHCAQGLWVVYAYKFIHDRIELLVLKVLAWVGTMLVYYLLGWVGAVFHFMLFQNAAPTALQTAVQSGPPAAILIQQFVLFVRGISGEVMITTIITMLILFFALSKKFQKPLWYEPKLNSELSNTMNKDDVVA